MKSILFVLAYYAWHKNQVIIFKIRNFFYKINLTAEQGIEPRLLDPNSSVIPLDHSASKTVGSNENRTRNLLYITDVLTFTPKNHNK